MGAKIAVAGAGIYGATAAIRLAEHGHQVHLFDPLGLLRAASAINQYRVHAGYHYPRSPETISEITDVCANFRKLSRMPLSGTAGTITQFQKSIRSLHRIYTRP